MKTKSIVLIVVSLGFGCVAAVGMVQVMAKNRNAVPKTNTKPVLVALCDLDINDELSPENVKVEQWPANMVPEGVVIQWDGNEGRRVAGRVIKGYPIQSEMLLQPGEYSGLNIRRGYRVYAIKVSGQDAFAGLLKPGYRVDVMGVVKLAGTREEVAKTFLTNIRIFAVNDETSTAPSSEETSKEIRIVQLEVTHSQAEKLALVESVGSLRLALRSTMEQFAKDDEVPEDETEASIEELFGARQGTRQEKTDEPTEDGFDAGKLVVGLIQAWKTSQESDVMYDDYRPSGQHSMTMISSEGTYVYTWHDRTMPPVMSELAGGEGGYEPMRRPQPNMAPRNSQPTVRQDATPESLSDNDEFADQSDSDLEEEVNTPDDSNESASDNDLDW